GKPSYRLVREKPKDKNDKELGRGGQPRQDAKEQKESRPYLQGWAVVENTTDEDWNAVRMALISGRPISFQMNLYDALFIKRPVVEPELFASLRPPTYSGGLGGEAGFARTAPMAPPGFPAPQEKAANGEGRGLAGPGGFGGGFGGGTGGGFGRRSGATHSREVLNELQDKMDLGTSVASAASAAKLG